RGRRASRCGARSAAGRGRLPSLAASQRRRGASSRRGGGVRGGGGVAGVLGVGALGREAVLGLIGGELGAASSGLGAGLEVALGEGDLQQGEGVAVVFLA